MGLFGREDRSTETKPTAQPAPSPARGTASGSPARTGATVVAASCRVEGVLSGSGDLLIEGQVSGEINGTATVSIAEGGHVDATVHGRTVVVAGRVRGDISATDKIELTPSADVAGNITSPRILIREGATFEGQVFMKSPDARKPGSAQATSDAKASDAKGGDTKDAKNDGGGSDKGPSGNAKGGRNR